MKKYLLLLLGITATIHSFAQTCIGSAGLVTGPGTFQWMERAGDNLVVCGGVYYGTTYTYSGTTLSAPAGAVANCYVVMTDTNFNLVRMFNHISFFRPGGAFNDLRIWNMAVDKDKNVWFCGSYTDSMLVYGADTVLSDRYQEAFAAKSDSTGQPMLLKSFGSRSLSGNYSFEDRAQAITTDADGNVYIGICFEGDYLKVNNTDTVNNGTYVGLNSYRQAAVVALTATGQTRWLKAFGTPTQDENVFGIAVTSQKDVTVCGSTTASNQVFRFGNLSYLFKSSPNGFQAYAAQFDSSGNARWLYPLETYVGTGPDVSAYDVAVDGNDNSYIAGYFDGNAIFNSDTIVTGNYTSSYLLKVSRGGQRLFLKTGNIDTFYPYPVAVKVQGDKVFMTGQSFTNQLKFEHLGLCCSREVYFAMYDTTGALEFLKAWSTAGSADAVGFDVAFTANGIGMGCGMVRNGQCTLEPNTVTASSGGDYYLVRFGDVPSNGLTMSVVNNGSDTIACGASTPLQMQVTPTTNTRYFWSADNDTIPGPFYNQTLNATPKFTSTYIAVAYNNACVVVDTIVVYVNPIAAEAGSDTAVCLGEQLQLNGNTIFNGTYLWSPATGLSSDTIADPVLTVSNSTQLVYQVKANGCVNTDTLSVTAIPDPAAQFTYVQNNLQVSLSNLTFGGPATYIWNFGDGVVDTLSGNPTHVYATSGIYNVCLIAVGDCGSDTVCQSIAITNVGLNEQPDAPVISETSSEVFIRAGSGNVLHLLVMDMSGRIIYNERIAANQAVIQKSLLPTGVFILSAEDSRTIVRQRIFSVK